MMKSKIKESKISISVDSLKSIHDIPYDTTTNFCSFLNYSDLKNLSGTCLAYQKIIMTECSFEIHQVIAELDTYQRKLHKRRNFFNSVNSILDISLQCSLPFLQETWLLSSAISQVNNNYCQNIIWGANKIFLTECKFPDSLNALDNFNCSDSCPLPTNNYALYKYFRDSNLMECKKLYDTFFNSGVCSSYGLTGILSHAPTILSLQLFSFGLLQLLDYFKIIASPAKEIADLPTAMILKLLNASNKILPNEGQDAGQIELEEFKRIKISDVLSCLRFFNQTRKVEFKPLKPPSRTFEV